MKVVTAEMMRSLDRLAMEEAGISGAALMENAGRAVFDAIHTRFDPLPGKRIVICAGTGNNGGDGFVAARLLHLAGASVSVHLAGDAASIKGDAERNYRLALQMGLIANRLPEQADVKVDALLGTGSTGAPRERYAEAIRWMNGSPGPTVAVDIPSGINSDSGDAAGDAVNAALTVTFGYPKLGLFLRDGVDSVGELRTDRIGFDWDSLSCDSPYQMSQRVELAGLLPPRKRDAHKGLFGHVLIVGGSLGMSGAPAMAAKAAVRCGAGLVTAAVPSGVQAIVAGRADEVMTVAVPENDGALFAGSLGTIHTSSERADVLCVGPGIGSINAARSLALSVLREIDKPAVLDADGLNGLAAQPEALIGRRAPTVLTPHPGECARLLGTTAVAVHEDRVGSVKRAAEQFRSVVVLKGAYTLIADGRSGRADRIAINTTGNPGMATGGSGDSLTGIIGALIGQGLDAFDAARLGVYVHGRAGDLAAERIGKVGLAAGDIIEHIPEALQELESNEG